MTNNATQPAQSTSARKPPPPIANRIIKAILRSPLHGLLSGQMMLVTFNGRKTGKQYTTPVTQIRDGDGYRFFTSYGWWKNLRGGAPVTLLVRRQPLDGTATVHEDRETVLREARAYLAANGLKSAWKIGLQLDTKREPSDAELSEKLQNHVLVTVRR